MVAAGDVGIVLGCEDLDDALSRPPLAAVRFFRILGFKLSLRAWRSLSTDVRWAIAREGACDVVDKHAAHMLLRQIPLRHIELTGDTSVPETTPFPGVLEALGVPPSWVDTGWKHLRPFHRFVLNVLRTNRRLLWRAYAEIHGVGVGRHDGWRGLVAHAEVEIRAEEPIRSELLHLLLTDKLLDGRALLLARASGLRVARTAGELFDLYSERVTGAVELDWSIEIASGTILWQAHASTHLGEFFAIASLAAATTAAVCLSDMIKEFDPLVRIREAEVIEEEWCVGKFDDDSATTIYLGARRL